MGESFPADRAPPAERSRAALEAYVADAVGRPVALTLTDNVRSMISFRDARPAESAAGGVVLRLHRMFTRAPAEVLDDIAAWIRAPRRRPASVRSFMQAQRAAVRPPAARRRHLQPRGRHHDLAELFARLNAEYFGSQLEMAITWGRRHAKRFPRTIRLGSYDHETGVITISPRLDRARVPQYFVCFVIYHEMLHAHLGVRHDENGRRRIHTAEFRRHERAFAEYDRAMAFERRFFG
jgi:hypothetical protein